MWQKTSSSQSVVMNTFGWQRLEVVRLNDVNEEDEPNKPKRARLEQHSHTQLLHDGSEIGTQYSTG